MTPDEILKIVNNKFIQKSEFTLNGEQVFELNYPNGDLEYVTIMFLDEDVVNEPTLTRVPKHKLDLKNGNSEIVSDVSQVLDVDLNYPTMLEKIAQLEGLGQYDDDDDFDEIMSEDGDLISPYEVRAIEAQNRLTELRKKQFEKEEEKILKVRLDQIKDRQQNLAKETKDDLKDLEPNLVSGRGEPTEAK